MRTLPDYRLESDDNISLERAKVKAAYSLTGKFLILSATLTALTFVAWLIGVGVGLSPSIGLNTFLAVAFLLLSLIVTTSVLESRTEKQKQMRDRLTPLSETNKCSTALFYVESSPGAREIHNTAMALGRQLYVFDFEAMQQCVEQEEQSKNEQRKLERAQKNAEACRKLHGVAI